jgi:4-hydroxy-4-methyl-2-oxoglutarate aldolase
MRNVVVTGCPRADLAAVDELARYGVATVYEAAGRTGYLGSAIRPVYLGTRTGGTAVTAVCWPGDNLMIHAAVEQCQAGDILVVTTTSPNTDGSDCVSRRRCGRFPVASMDSGESGSLWLCRPF